MSGFKATSYFSIAIILVSAVVLAQSQDQYACLAPIGGVANIIDKKIVTESPFNEGSEFLESNIPQPYRISRPGSPVTDDLRPDRITISVDVDNIVTDAECI